ncbi:hypothetical protein PR001_g22793 [Phytophthora rubi]|uniref:SWIM-type domain-containing protein n=1 Tax=Phytophthora rubi TaxID=129364 RepID=A0A6A3JVM7_9STRA|nr:hypothetical protein PR001_g22793 [Phytophthora rubi]KAE8998951.1 hypothetical protein PR002_g18598 [Phytophthora rubi]
MEHAFGKLILCYTERTFNSELESFTKVCEKECPDLLEYFTANWMEGDSMWAKYIRGKYFSAGNTTTSSIESNWNQVEMLLGKRHRLDATISGMLAHQGTIIRQVLATMRKHVSTSRHPDAIPDFLTRVAARLSDYPLSKVRSQWDRFMVYLADTKSTKLDAVGEWELSTRRNTYVCNDYEGTCTCIYYCSNHLPCQHLMYVADRVHRFEYLPESTVPQRSDMVAMSELEKELCGGAESAKILFRLDRATTAPRHRLTEGVPL